jgi:hypothetical protein
MSRYAESSDRAIQCQSTDTTTTNWSGHSEVSSDDGRARRYRRAVVA